MGVFSIHRVNVAVLRACSVPFPTAARAGRGDAACFVLCAWQASAPAVHVPTLVLRLPPGPYRGGSLAALLRLRGRGRSLYVSPCGCVL